MNTPNPLEPGVRYRRFADFYPYYLSEHANPLNRRLHVCGTVLAVVLAVVALVTGHFALLWLVPLAGYGFAWVGHFRVEHNRPATFQYPFYSLAGDFVMAWQVLTRRLV